MNMQASHQGYAFLVVLVLVILGGFATSKIAESGALQHALQLEQQTRQSQILDHIRSGLLGFASTQGIHSQSHLGHLPCPATLPEGPPQTTCLAKPWAYLPIHSKTAINYLNRGISARNHELAHAASHHWHYAVSAQLLQPNALGWSRWVDYSKPAMRIRIPAQQNRIEENIAAVVAKSIQSTGEHHYDVTPPYMLIRVNELQAHMVQAQIHLLRDTLRNTNNPPHENLIQAPGTTNTFTPVNSNCACRCTKTKCTCNCDEPGQWSSTSSEQPVCFSTPESPCIFAGPATLQSQWPVSRFEPVAASNKSCRPSKRQECPLSTNSTACTCDFSWPDNTKADLANFQITYSPISGMVVNQVKP
ncbi:hypothetical protein [Limnobacter sp.]|uniref:hypothetical protein n=1 Tax=Limnobacter sp. TaxID=2003368 RepID=UPI002FE2B298